MKLRSFLNRPGSMTGIGCLCLSAGLILNNFHRQLGINEFFAGLLIGMSLVFLVRGAWVSRHGGSKACGS